ncbi:MAG: hypothetical protein EBU90_08355, partial [Proteobacteria bacterium]|nr:hypothetical protein [Pseudomonadota bacterium]
MSRKKYNSKLQLINAGDRKTLFIGTTNEMIKYILENIKEAVGKDNNNLTTQISNSLRNGTLLFRKYEIAEDQPVKHIAPNKHSVPSQYLQTVTLNNTRMLEELERLEKYKKRLPNAHDVIEEQERNIEKLKLVNC